MVSRLRAALAVAAVACAGTARLAAQDGMPVQLRAERQAFSAWLAQAPTSPYAAVAQQPIGEGLTLGPGGDLPLEGLAGIRITARGGRILLAVDDSERTLPRYRPTGLGRYTLVAGGTARRPMLTVFDSTRPRRAPEYLAYDPSLVFVGTLTPPARPRTERLLAPDGIEIEATEAGSVVVPLGGTATRLRVMRIPDPATGESELEIFFRDSTNLSSTYPAGRFVTLVPEGGRYRLDFNRARNPFCAYSTAYACPLPWQGNAIPAPVRAGELYLPPQ